MLGAGGVWRFVLFFLNIFKKPDIPLDRGLLFSPFIEIVEVPAVSSTSERCGGKLKAGPLDEGTLGDDGFEP